MKKGTPNSASEIRGEVKAREHETKVYNERIVLVEKHFGALHKEFSALATGLGSLRDNGDRLAKSLDAYAEEEYPSTRQALSAMAEQFASIQDHLQNEIDALQVKVLQPLSLQSTNCKHAREYMKAASTARDKELSKMKAVEKIRSKGNASKTSQAEQEMIKLSSDANRARQTLEEQMHGMEKTRLNELKVIFSNFIKAEMERHVRSLELYTQAYLTMQSLDEEQDLEAFTAQLHPPNLGHGSSNNLLSATSHGSINTSQLSLNQYAGSYRGSQQSLNRTAQSNNMSSFASDDDD